MKPQVKPRVAAAGDRRHCSRSLGTTKTGMVYRLRGDPWQALEREPTLAGQAATKLFARFQEDDVPARWPLIASSDHPRTQLAVKQPSSSQKWRHRAPTASISSGTSFFGLLTRVLRAKLSSCDRFPSLRSDPAELASRAV